MVKWLYGCVFLLFYFLFLNFNFSYAQTELTVTIDVGDTILTLSGKTSPNAQVTVVESGAVVGTTTADANGDFSKSLLAQTAGVHSIGIYSTDSYNVTSSTVNYSVSLTALQETTLSNIILPPTISLSSSELTKGDNLEISGLTAPSSTVSLFITSPTVTKTTTSANSGKWSYTYSTGDLETGDHTVYAKTTTSAGYQSESSKIKSFKIKAAPTATPAPAATATPTPAPAATATPTPVPRPIIPAIVAVFDIDASGRIEISEVFTAVKSWVDEWRKVLFKEKEPKNCDLNRDRRCDLIDLSILLYYIGR